MRTFAVLLLLALLVLVGVFPWLAAAVAGLVTLAFQGAVLAFVGAVTLLAEPPILVTVLVALAVVAKRRRWRFA